MLCTNRRSKLDTSASGMARLNTRIVVYGKCTAPNPDNTPNKEIPNTAVRDTTRIIVHFPATSVPSRATCACALPLARIDINVTTKIAVLTVASAMAFTRPRRRSRTPSTPPTPPIVTSTVLATIASNAPKNICQGATTSNAAVANLKFNAQCPRKNSFVITPATSYNININIELVTANVVANVHPTRGEIKSRVSAHSALLRNQSPNA
mmetsp:Transcript_968/g.3061  ORF Transcript_968/g.3061 Transcript_968/m.3061 type:complete len:209 (+) Transcript_968:964-1590(+)